MTIFKKGLVFLRCMSLENTLKDFQSISLKNIFELLFVKPKLVKLIRKNYDILRMKDLPRIRKLINPIFISESNSDLNFLDYFEDFFKIIRDPNIFEKLIGNYKDISYDDLVNLKQLTKVSETVSSKDNNYSYWMKLSILNSVGSYLCFKDHSEEAYSTLNLNDEEIVNKLTMESHFLSHSNNSLLNLLKLINDFKPSSKLNNNYSKNRNYKHTLVLAQYNYLYFINSLNSAKSIKRLGLSFTKVRTHYVSSLVKASIGAFNLAKSLGFNTEIEGFPLHNSTSEWYLESISQGKQALKIQDGQLDKASYIYCCECIDEKQIEQQNKLNKLYFDRLRTVKFITRAYQNLINQTSNKKDKTSFLTELSTLISYCYTSKEFQKPKNKKEIDLMLGLYRTLSYIFRLNRINLVAPNFESLKDSFESLKRDYHLKRDQIYKVNMISNLDIDSSISVHDLNAELDALPLRLPRNIYVRTAYSSSLEQKLCHSQNVPLTDIFTALEME